MNPFQDKRRGVGRAGGSLLLLGLLLVLLLPASATADGRIGGSSKLPAAVLPGGIFAPEGGGLAVSEKEAGDVYIVDDGPNQRVSQFAPDGAFVRAFGWGIVPGAATGTGDLLAGARSITHVVTTTGSFNSGYFGLGKIISGPGIPPETEITGVGQSEISLSKPATVTGNGVSIAVATGPGNVPTNELQQLTVAATGGAFQLIFTSPQPGSTTEATSSASEIAYDAPASGHGSVQEALEDLPVIGPGNVSVTGGPGDENGTHPYLIEFKGRYADTNVRPLQPQSTNNLTGPSPHASAVTLTEGAGVLETCTTVCSEQSSEEGTGEVGEGSGQGSEPGRLNYADALAIDNDPASETYGDVYVVDQRNYRVERYSPMGAFELMLGGEVDKGPHHPGNVCTAAYIAEGDVCGTGVPGTGAAHFYKEEPQTEAGHRKAWANTGSNSIAIGPEGVVYVGDYGRIQEFEPDGSFVGEFVLPVGSGEEPLFVSGLAVDPAGNIYERSANYGSTGGPEALLGQVPGVREFDASHLLVRTLDAEDADSEPIHLALDEHGDLFVTDNSGAGVQEGGEFLFRAFKPTGTLYAEFTSDQVGVPDRVQAPGQPGVSGIGGAINVGVAVGGNTVYASAQKSAENINEGFVAEAHIATIPVPDVGAPEAREEHVTDVEPTTATLHAIVNPKGFATAYHFEYVDQHGFESGGFSNPAAESTATQTLPLVIHNDPVLAAISGLTPATIYHFRIVAESHCNEAVPSEVCIVKGPGVEFESLPPTSVRGLTTQTVGPELVKLKAELNPNDQSATYTVRYGENESYSGGSTQGQLAVGNEFTDVTATFTGLKPHTEYHYQLIAVSANGEEVATEDQTFVTERSSAEERAAEDCEANGTIHGAPNSALREENNSTALPDCRAYEQVTPTDKNGGEAAMGGTQLAPSGGRAHYFSTGTFAGASVNEVAVEYIAHRTSAGWVSQAVLGRPAPPGIEPAATSLLEGTYASAELDRWIFAEVPGLNSERAKDEEKMGYLTMGFADGSDLLHASPTINLLEGVGRTFYSWLAPVRASSEDLSRLYLYTSARLLTSDPRRDDYLHEGFLSDTAATRIYEIAGADGPAPTIQLAAEVPTGLTGLECGIDNDTSMGQPGVRLASADASHLFYTAPVEVEGAGSAPCGIGTPNPIGLFVRVNSDSPVQLDVPPPGQCSAPAPCATGAVGSTLTGETLFYGTSPDGARAWFTTSRPLINSDTDTGVDLYLAKLGEGGSPTELVQASAGEATASHPNPGEGAGVRAVDRVSADGSHAAFVATGVLTDKPNSIGGSAVQGANNLYVFDADSGETKFVTRLCSGPEASGPTHDAACPSTLSSSEELLVEIGNDKQFWQPTSTPPAVFTPDGRYLLFTSSGRLTTNDTDDVRDVYRFDFQTGELKRISFGRNGNDANGNDDAFPAEIGQPPSSSEPLELAEDTGRSISEDGKTIVFKTAAPLVSHDTNAGENPGCGQHTTGCDVYEWEEQGHGTCVEAGGCISLISSGLDPQGAEDGLISDSGRDITFQTRRNMIPADTDGVGDIYDARVDGGFPGPHPPPTCGSPEGCRPAGAGEPAPPTIATPNFVGPGNSREQLECAKGRHRVRKHGEFRCVSNLHKNHHKKKHRHRKHAHQRSAGHHRRAGK